MPAVWHSKGGIEVYCHYILQALRHKCGPYRVFIKNDTHLLCTSDYSENIQFHAFGKWSPWLRTLVFAINLFLYALIQQPTLILCAHLHFAAIAYWIQRFAKVPYWVFVYGIEAWDVKSQLLKEALRHADCILAISNYTRERLIQEQGIDPKKVKLLFNPIDSSRFSIANKPERLLKFYGLQPEQPVLLTVSRLAESERYKGYDAVLQALPNILKRMPNLHYIIVGKGNDRQRIEQLIETLGIQNSVTLAGFIPDEELCDYYNLCDIFVMPSKKEGFGFVYLEALACGKPVIGGKFDGAVDALGGGLLGALIDPDNKDELVETILLILEGCYSNPLMYQPQLLRQKTLELFGYEKFQQTLNQYLEDGIVNEQL